MPALVLALALLLADEPVQAAAGGAGASEAAQPAWPTGAPRGDYELVSWCHGALTGYLELHDTVMPEVTRIESAFRAPGRSLEEDLAIYAQMQRDGRRQLKVFAAAMEAAEKASIRPINAAGAEAVKKGRSIWAAAPNLPKARVAQEWMSWALPARCELTAIELEKRAKVLGAAFQVETAAAPAEAAPPADGPSEEAAPAQEAIPAEAPAEEAAAAE